MNHMISNEGIKRNIVSVYTSLEPGNSSHVKFGGYDDKGIDPKYNLVQLQTVNTSTWAVGLQYFMFAD